ncbi:MAG: hypothetical protein ACKOA8_05745 [Deltaproteobacteria bacterium]
MSFYLNFLFGIFLFSSVSFSGSCLKTVQKLIPQGRNVGEIYSELQKQDENGKTKLALQSDFDDLIREGGGGACASATAFNLLQGLRVMAGLKTLQPKHNLSRAFRALPELLDGRVTNTQMNQLLKYFEKHFPKHQLKISALRTSQSQAAPGEAPGEVSEKWDENLFVPKSNEIKMVIYQVHDAKGLLVGRHFVVLKNYEPGKIITVIDPNYPHKELKFQLTEETDPATGKPLTRVSRADGVPHRLGWVFTLDTLFSAQLESKSSR